VQIRSPHLVEIFFGENKSTLFNRNFIWCK